MEAFLPEDSGLCVTLTLKLTRTVSITVRDDNRDSEGRKHKTRCGFVLVVKLTVPSALGVLW